jgi:hypothetical protein
VLVLLPLVARSRLYMMGLLRTTILKNPVLQRSLVEKVRSIVKFQAREIKVYRASTYIDVDVDVDVVAVVVVVVVVKSAM